MNTVQPCSLTANHDTLELVSATEPDSPASLQEKTQTTPKKKSSGSNLVAAGILLSRLAGIVREQVIAAALDTKTTDAFRFAMRIPNLLQNLLGEGSLSASFIPVYSKLLEDGEQDKAHRLATSVLALLLAVTTLIVSIIIVAARPIVWLFTSWETDPTLYELAITLTRITTIGIGFLVISAWCLGILNSHRSFFLSYVAPVIWNAAQILALLVAIIFSWQETDAVLWVAWAVVIGSILQLFVQLPRVNRLVKPASATTHTPSSRFTFSPELKSVLSRFAPAVGARGVVQISSLLDTALLGALAVGALGVYGFVLPLYLMPISLFGFSIAAAELAEMSRYSDAKERILSRLTPALQKVIVPAGFITSAYVAASTVFIDALYGVPSRLLSDNPNFTDDKVLAVAMLLAVFAFALPAAMSARITQNTLYSLGNVKTPARIAIVRLVVMTIVSFIAMMQFDWLYIEDGAVKAIEQLPHWPIWQRLPDTTTSAAIERTHLGVLGVGCGAVVASWVEWFLLRRALRKDLGAAIASGWFRHIVTASAAAFAVMLALRFVPLPSLLVAPMIVLIGAGVYAFVLRRLGINVLTVMNR